MIVFETIWKTLLYFLKNPFRGTPLDKPLHELYPEIIYWNIGDSLSIWYKFGSRSEWHGGWKVENILETEIVISDHYSVSRFDDSPSHISFERKLSQGAIVVSGTLHYLGREIFGKDFKVRNDRLYKETGGQL